ncbi:tetratricopeptide repeat protein [candidate division KSB1 bacterium]|nr:tetratricopeptide repeat protein [candidate division KSB1 bacterium]
MNMSILLYVFLLIAPKAEIGKANTDFQKGNEFYQQGEYQQAVEMYETALSTGYESAEIYYNLGNAYFKSNQIGKSILNYERAKKLTPRDEDILFNLDIARLYVVDKINLPPQLFLIFFWKNVKDFFVTKDLGILTLAIYIVLISLLIVRIFIRNHFFKKVTGIAVIPVFILFLFSALIFIQRINEDINLKEAIVIAKRIDVTSSPSKDATEVFALHEGVKVKISERSGDFLRIELSDGKIGWINVSTVEII